MDASTGSGSGGNGGSTGGGISCDDPGARNIEVAELDPLNRLMTKAYGHTGDGNYGVPVGNGKDIDGDGHVDVAFSAMVASPMGRNSAGEVYLIFGDGTFGKSLDTAVSDPDILQIAGVQSCEMAGSEIWIDDVTGDGLGDLLIARQNYSPPGRWGAGALTIVVGSADVRTFAATRQVLDLGAPPPGIEIITFLGAAELDRFGIWVKTGDVDGDGTPDIVVGADMADEPESQSGAVYVIRGGSHLGASETIDLLEFGTTALAGHVARVNPPPGSADYHMGATVSVGDLDNNNRAEVVMSATLIRSGAGLGPDDGNGCTTAAKTGGAPRGTVYVAWDDNFAGNPWVSGYTINLDSPPGALTTIYGTVANGGWQGGGYDNQKLGEEALVGSDFDGDGNSDLFLGDMGGAAKNRWGPGLGFVVWNAAETKGATFDIDQPPGNSSVTVMYGPNNGAIASDTAFGGDFNGDGIDDLSFSAPSAHPADRQEAGIVYVIWGRVGGWPAAFDLFHASQPPDSDVIITDINGANGNGPGDAGDMLGYSGQSGDINGDGLTDLAINEMGGNGLGGGTVDVGNLLLLSGEMISCGP